MDEQVAPDSVEPTPTKLTIKIAVNRATGDVALEVNQDPVVMSVKDLTGLMNQVVQQMRPKQARRIILPGELNGR